MNDVPNCFYRVSTKGLLLDQTGKKFAIIFDSKGSWELPGGGLDFGESLREALTREIREEMGLVVTDMDALPLYCLIGKNKKDQWCLNLVFNVKVKDLNFTPTNECQELKFVSPKEVKSLNDAYWNVKELAKQFNKK